MSDRNITIKQVTRNINISHVGRRGPIGLTGPAASWGNIPGDISDQTDLQAALDAKANESDFLAHTGNVSNPHEVTKEQIGLANVDNTSDAAKPISTATQQYVDSRLQYRGAWAQATAYAVNDIVQQQGASFVCLTAHTSTTGGTGAASNFQIDFSTNGYWRQLGRRQQWYDVRDYGAKIDNTNDTTSIQAAIDACAAAGGGVVFIPEGTVAVTTLTLKNHVWLRGAGMFATTIRCLSSTNANVIKDYQSTNATTDPNGEYCGVLDLQIDGNKTGNTGSTSHGINLTVNPTNTQAVPGDDTFDTHHLIQNVRIKNCAGIGFNQTGRSETRLINVVAEKNDSGGISTSYDTFLESCTAGNNGVFGFSFTHGNIMANNCKAFLAGRDAITNSPGFSVTTGGVNVTMTGCIAQNNNGQGFKLDTVNSIIMSGCVADSNNYGTGNAATDYAGVEMNNCKHCIIDFISAQTSQGGSPVGNQGCALRIKGGSDFNDIRISTMAQTPYTLTSTLTSDSVTTATTNRIVADGAMVYPLPKITDDSDVAITSVADGQTLQYDAATSKWKNSTAPLGTFLGGLLGDGSDGSATLDGTATVAWASKSGNTYTITRDPQLTALTVNSGVTLIATGFRIFCQGTIANAGTISADGVAATSATGALASTSRSLQSGTKGGNGTTTTGAAGNNAPGGFSVGVGGTGGSATSAGAAGGTIGNTGTYMLRPAQACAVGTVSFAGTVSAICGGSGGGGGGGDGTTAGGGGGTGGSIVCVYARTFTNTGTVSAVGGAGFSPLTTNAGGGGGGGGGLIIVYSVNSWTQGTTVVTGGAGGTGHGTGTNGANGGAGNALNVVLK